MIRLTEAYTKNKLSGFYIHCEPFENKRTEDIKGRRWQPSRKAWRCPLTLSGLTKVIRRWPQAVMPKNLSLWYESEKAYFLEALRMHTVEDAEVEGPFADKLLPHQRVAVRFMTNSRRCILADDMGLGKTVSFISACVETGSKKNLVVATNNNREHIKRRIQEWDPDAIPVIVSGSQKKRLEILDLCVRATKPVYVIVNPEMIRFVTKKEHGPNVNPYLDALLKIEWDTITIDEAHNYCSRKSQQTIGATALSKKCKHMFLLTGTPVSNSVTDLWPLLHILDPHEFSSYWDFVKEHATVFVTPFGWKVDPKPTNPDKLARQIGHRYLRREEDEVDMSLPERLPVREVWVDLVGEQKRIYDEMDQEMIAELGPYEIIAAPVALAQMTRLKQIAISPRILSPDLELGAKIPSAMSLIKNNPDKKFVVFSQFKEALELLMEELDKEQIRFVDATGNVKKDERDTLVQEFQQDQGIKVCMMTYKSGGEGIELYSASAVIRLDKWWTNTTNSQAVKRVHRKGQVNPVHTFDILARATIDEYIEEVIEKKISIVELIVRKVRERYKEEMKGVPR